MRLAPIDIYGNFAKKRLLLFLSLLLLSESIYKCAIFVLIVSKDNVTMEISVALFGVTLIY